MEMKDKTPLVSEMLKKDLIQNLGKEKGEELFELIKKKKKEEEKAGVVDIFSPLLEEELKNEN